MSWNKGVWKKRGKTIKGSWIYIWSRDEFVIRLDIRCPITGDKIETTSCCDDGPHFNGWKLVREKAKVTA